jgi:DNA-binding MarR family transcriptional regulator
MKDFNVAAGLADLDRLVHEPARLAILTLLATGGETDFVLLQARAGLTAGNLATHLARLERAGFVRVSKGFEGRRPRTLLALTEAGRTALATWRRHIRRLLDLPE